MENRKNILRTVTEISIILLIIFISFVYQDRKDNVVVSADAVVLATNQAITIDNTKKTILYPANERINGEIKYGYIDSNGNFIIKPTYQIARNFSDGVAVVSDGEANLVIDVKGKVIFRTNGTISDFHNGRAAFSDPSRTFKQGYINTKGKVVIKPQYDMAGNFNEKGTALVNAKTGKYFLIDKNGKVQKTYKVSAKYGSFNPYDNGYLIFCDRNTLLYGVADLKGKVIYKPIYGQIEYLGNNLFGMKKKPTVTNLGLLQIMPEALFNHKGKQLTKYSLYDVSKFTGKYASCTDSNSTYFIDQNGKRVTSLPKLMGKGTMTIIGDIIQADIDDELTYMKKDGSVIWRYDSTYNFTSGIKVKAYKFKPNKYALVYYPKIEGMSNKELQNSINTLLKSKFTKPRRNLKITDGLSIDDSFNAEKFDDLLVIYRYGYDYYFGGAHGTPFRDNYFIDLKSGAIYTLQDLFKSNSNYISKLSSIIKNMMKEQTKIGKMIYFPDSFKEIRKNQGFYIKNDRLVIYFDSCEIAAYAAGFPEFEIPFKDIKDIINTEGSFWKAFHKE